MLKSLPFQWILFKNRKNTILLSCIMDDIKAQPVMEQEMASLYQGHYRQLCVVALNYVYDIELAQDIVQDFFINYWERRAQGIDEPDNFKGYAARAVRNISIDRLRKQSVEERRIDEWNKEEDQGASEDQDQLDDYHTRLQRIFELLSNSLRDNVRF